MPDDFSTLSLALDFDLGPKAVADLRKTFLDRRGDALEIDASQVAQIGGGCLQVLLSAKKTWEQDEKPFHITSPSAELTDAFALAGLTDTFSDETGAIA